MRKSLADSKYVRIMLDHCSTGLWNIKGYNVDEEELPVTSDLIVRIKAWQCIFDNIDWHTNSAEHSEVYKNLCYENLAIAIAVAKQLPDWTIVIYNDGEFDLPRCDRRNSRITSNMVAKSFSYNNQLHSEDCV